MTAITHPAQVPTAAWQRAVPLVFVLGVLLWMFRETGAAMVSIWSRSDTFAHAFLVPPISLALIWRKRAELAGVQVMPSPIWLLPLLLCCAVWLLGELAGVNAATQGALVGMMACAVPAVLGARVARIIAFPLLFLFFSVPVGDFLIEPMMEGTADFTVAALRLSGVPVYREGLQFVIPSGNWSVISACSGVRYLIASVMVGTLFAYLNFHSLKRRLAFVAVAVVVPVLANWLRAYMIVMLGHLSSNKIAAGVDHLIYGWIFFGVVILLMFMIGARFVDAPPPKAAVRMSGAGSVLATSRIAHCWAVAVVVGLALAGTRAFPDHIGSPGTGTAPVLVLPAQLRAPDSVGANMWDAMEEPVTSWKPVYRNAAAFVAAQYQQVGGHEGDTVGVWIGKYRDQGYKRKMITSTNVLVEEGSTRWQAHAQPASRVAVPAAETSVEVRATLLREPADPKVSPTQRLLVWRVYRVADRFVASDALAKLWLAFQRLSGRGDDSTVLMFYTRLSEDGQGAERLRQFVSQHLVTINAGIDATAYGASPRR